MSFITLDVSNHSWIVREADPDDEWDRDDTCTDWHVHGVRISESDSEFALPNTDFKVGDTIFCLVAVYSTGDTFGHDEGGEFEFISFHRSEELAYKNKNQIEARTHCDERYKYALELDNGEVLTRHCPWDGYFESLDYVKVHEFIIRDK